SATIAVGTEEELAAASGTQDVEEGAATLFDGGIHALVLKRGARGSTVFRADRGPSDVAPFPIEVLNVLGAGDAFASGFLYGYLQGWPLERAARMGNACGAIVVTRHGCANFMPKQRSARDGREQPFFGGVFGIFGHGNVAGIGQALQEQRDTLPYYLARNEQAMVHIAAAYAKM